MTDITIPPEVLEAAKRDAAVAIYRLFEPDTRAHELTEDEVREIARAACLAMLRSWPGMAYRYRMSVSLEPQEIVLPITENTNV